MHDWIFRTLISDYEDVKNPAVRDQYGKVAGVVGILSNTLLCVMKILVGLLSGSIAIVADAVNNLADASSSLITLIGFKLAAMPEDKEHPYGHARIEYLAGLLVSVIIIVVGLELGKSSIEKILAPTPTEFSLTVVIVLLLAIGIKIWQACFNVQAGKKINSMTLIATGADSRNDVLSTAAVLVAAILCRVTGWDVLDGLMGVGVAVFILISGWGLVMDTLSPLLGESPSEDLVEHIEQTVMSYPGVLGVHDLMVHDYGPGHQFASIHVELPAEQDPLEAHDLIDNIERDFMKNDHLMVTIHYDPIVTSDAAVGVLRSRLTEKLRQLDPALSLHDLRIVPGKTHTNVLFDLVLPAGYAGDKVELLTQMEQFIKEQDPTYNCIIKLEQSYTAAAHK